MIPVAVVLTLRARIWRIPEKINLILFYSVRAPKCIDRFIYILNINECVKISNELHWRSPLMN